MGPGLYDDLSGALAARHARPVLRDGDLRVAFAEGHTVAYVRTNDAGADAALVVINANDIARHPAQILVPELAGRALRVVPWRRSVSAATTSPVVPLRVSSDGWVTVEAAAREGVLLDAE